MGKILLRCKECDHLQYEDGECYGTCLKYNRRLSEEDMQEEICDYPTDIKKKNGLIKPVDRIPPWKKKDWIDLYK